METPSNPEDYQPVDSDRAILEALIKSIRPDWNGDGAKLWLQRQLAKLEEPSNGLL